MSEFGAWAEILPDVSRASMAEDDREARAEQKQDEEKQAERAAAAENTAFAKRLAGNVWQTPGEFIASRQGVLADRIPKALRGPVDAEVCVAPVRRYRGPRDGDVIERAVMAAEARRIDQREADAAAALQAARELRRRPQADEYTSAWSAFRGTR